MNVKGRLAVSDHFEARWNALSITLNGTSKLDAKATHPEKQAELPLTCGPSWNVLWGVKRSLAAPLSVGCSPSF